MGTALWGEEGGGKEQQKAKKENEMGPGTCFTYSAKKRGYGRWKLLEEKSVHLLKLRVQGGGRGGKRKKEKKNFGKSFALAGLPLLWERVAIGKKKPNIPTKNA